MQNSYYQNYAYPQQQQPMPQQAQPMMAPPQPPVWPAPQPPVWPSAVQTPQMPPLGHMAAPPMYPVQQQQPYYTMHVPEPPPKILVQMAQYAPSIVEFIMAGKRVCKETGKNETDVKDVVNSLMAMFSHIVSIPMDRFPATANLAGQSELEAKIQQANEKIEAANRAVAEQENVGLRLKTISEQVMKDYQALTQSTAQEIQKNVTSAVTMNHHQGRTDSVPYYYNGQVHDEYTSLRQMQAPPPLEHPPTLPGLRGVHRGEAPGSLESRAALTLRSHEVADRVTHGAENYQAVVENGYQAPRSAPPVQYRAHMPYVPMTKDDEQHRNLRIPANADDIPDEDMDRIRRKRLQKEAEEKNRRQLEQQEALQRERELVRQRQEASQRPDPVDLKNSVLEIMAAIELERRENEAKAKEQEPSLIDLKEDSVQSMSSSA